MTCQHDWIPCYDGKAVPGKPPCRSHEVCATCGRVRYI